MLRGVTVEIEYATVFNTPEGDSETSYSEPERVDNVLVAMPTVADASSTRDLYGENVDVELYMPRSWLFRDVKDARIRLPDGRLVEVLGDYYPALTSARPTEWFLRVYARRIN